MTVKEIVNKFKNNPSYIKNGAETLSKLWKCTSEEINEARLIVRLEKLKKDSNEIKQTSHEKQFKRLFFDIETSYNIIADFSCGWNKTIGPQQILKERAIICICYKWETEDTVQYLTWDSDQDDKKMLSEFIKIAESSDEIIGHNSDKFDIKWLRTRCIYHRLPCPSKFRSLDTLRKSRSSFNFNSNKLDYIGQFLGVGEKSDTGGLQLWIDTVSGDKDALSNMVDYCINDVVLLEDVYNVLSPYIHQNTNFSVLNGLSKWHCPKCTSNKVKLRKSSTTVMGVIKRHMRCTCCEVQYDISNKTYMNYLQRNLINNDNS